MTSPVSFVLAIKMATGLVGWAVFMVCSIILILPIPICELRSGWARAVSVSIGFALLIIGIATAFWEIMI